MRYTKERSFLGKGRLFSKGQSGAYEMEACWHADVKDDGDGGGIAIADQCPNTSYQIEYRGQ